MVLSPIVREDLINKLNEAGGKLFEALTLLTLNEIFPGREIVWQPKCLFMNIQPDFCIGPVDKPDAIVLVTHATARNAAGVKIDRSLEELFEAKTRSPVEHIPSVINLIFHSPVGWSEGQLLRLDAAFDVNWVAFRDSPSYPMWVSSLASLANDIKGVSFDTATDAVRSKKIHLALAKELQKKFTNCVNSNLNTHDGVWLAERRRIKRCVANASIVDNKLKLDLMALAMIPQEQLSLFLDGRSMEHIQGLNLGIESGALIALGSRVRMNHDLHSRTSLALKQTHRSTLLTALDRFRITEGFSAYRMVYEPTEETAERLNKLFSASDADELKGLIDESWNRKSTGYTGTCWPIEYAVAAIQFLIDDDFGLLSLYRQSDGDLDDAFMWNPLTWYLIGKRNAIKDSEVSEISKTLVELLSVAKKKIRTFREIVPDIRAAMEIKLRRKKKANPLLWFVRSVIDSMSIVVEGFPDAAPTRYCPFAEVAKLGKVSGQMRWHFRIQPLTKGAGYRLLHVLSSYSQTHKHKEYALKGRLSMYVAKKGGIVRDTDIGEVAILLDGKWSASEVAVMASSGIRVFSISDVDLWSKWVAGK